jgi:hypothetical protein
VDIIDNKEFRVKNALLMVLLFIWNELRDGAFTHPRRVPDAAISNVHLIILRIARTVQKNKSSL